LDEVIAGLNHYAKNSIEFFKKSRSIGMSSTQVRNFVLSSMQEKGICGAFIIDIAVDMHIEINSSLSQDWNFSSNNNEFNRIHQAVRQENPHAFSLGCALARQKDSGGSVNLMIFSCSPVPSKLSLSEAPQTGRVHADIHAVSEELKIHAEYKMLTTKTIPFAVFVFYKNQYEHEDDLGHDSKPQAMGEPDADQVFLMTIPLTLLNPIYRSSTEYIDVIEKNLHFKI
jgi:hypothetical protein